ncbi:hypothetical protein CVD28_09895 [Bacillus sp. M6-12]|uniref:DUF4179 domain-containing protein n=1 Tax=Bacillus sp. M6-12 TaxID=2054166 RepID=UPI000C7578A6|nr:DUF4179 domain-containing protein [Bacillus sp. M6-12]PLS17987.1 hypothetical protein CVD28_09895 [Bacillus sp. M6-12]
MKTLEEQIKDSLDSIEVPDSLYQFAQNVSFIAEEQKARVPVNEQPKKHKNYRWAKSAIATAAAFGIVIGSGYVSPAMAAVLKEVPLVGSLFEESKSEITKVAVQKGYVNEVQKSAKANGILVNISDVYFDGLNMSVGYTIQSEKSLGEMKKADADPFTPVIKLDGKQESYMWSFEEIEKKGNKISGIMHINFNSNNAKTLQMTLNEVYGNKGEWKFNTPIENQKLQEDTVVLKPNIQKKWEKGNTVVSIEEIQVKPGHTDLVFSQKNDPGKNSISLANTCVAIYDSKGTLLGLGYGILNPAGNGKYSVSFPEIKSLPEKIILSLAQTGQLKFDNDPLVKHYEFSNKSKFPVNVPVDKDNHININSITETDKTVKVNFEIKGDISLQQQFMVITDKNGISGVPLDKKRVETGDSRMVFEQEFKKEPNFSGEILLKMSVDKDEFIRDYLRVEVPIKTQ